MKEKKKTSLIMNKYNCFLGRKKLKPNSLGITFWKNFRSKLLLSFINKELKAYNHKDFLWEVFYVEKLSKYLLKNRAFHYNIKIKVMLAFKYFKQITRVNPIIFCLYIFYFFMFQINYLHRTKHNLDYSIPKVFTNEYIPSIFTMREFSKILKKKNWNGDLETKLLIELILLLYNFKYSDFYLKGIIPYYKYGENANKYINFIW